MCPVLVELRSASSEGIADEYKSSPGDEIHSLPVLSNAYLLHITDVGLQKNVLRILLSAFRVSNINYTVVSRFIKHALCVVA